MTEVEARLTLEKAKLNRKRGRFSKFLVVLIFLLIITYTAVVLWFEMNMWTVPDSLTVAFFSAMIGEFSALGVIRTKKLRRDTEAVATSDGVGIE